MVIAEGGLLLDCLTPLLGIGWRLLTSISHDACQESMYISCYRFTTEKLRFKQCSLFICKSRGVELLGDRLLSWRWNLGTFLSITRGYLLRRVCIHLECDLIFLVLQHSPEEA